MTTTDFSTWLGCNDLSDYNDVYSLYRSVKDVDEYAGFKTVIGKKPNSRVVHSIECNEDLFLASDAAVDSFLNLIERLYCGGLNIEAYYIVNHENEKDD